MVLEYSRTIDGLIRTIFVSQKKSNLKRGFGDIGYSFEWFRKWILSQKNFYDLFKSWEKNGFKKDFKPSINRLNDYVGYKKNNIELMTWRENLDRYSIDRMNGINNKQNRPVFQIDYYSNEILKKHFSIKNASRLTGADPKNIKFCCDKVHKYNSAKGFKWAWASK